MIKKIIKYIVFLLCVLYFTSSIILAEPEVIDILLLNSYHDGYQWSNDTKQGIIDVLDQNIDNYYMRIEHMDTKNISSDSYMLELFNLYKFKYDTDEFDVIICADDNALKFLLKYSNELFAETPVFFSGVNILKAHDLKNVSNFYGVVEKHSIAETVTLALKQNPNLKNAYLVVDDSISGKATKVDAMSDMEELSEVVNFEIFNDMSYAEILDKVNTLDPYDSIVVQSVYVIDVNGASYPLEYTTSQLIERSNVPIYGLYSFGFGNGTVGGKFVEGYTQGLRVSEMVVEYLENGSITGEKYIVDASFNRYHFDYEAMKKHGLNPDTVPVGSIIINKPISFYERHNRVINISLLVMTMLLVYVYLLRRQINNQTERIIKTQTHLIEAENMASLGRLVAGVAHEINTPIGIGVTLASYLESETSKILIKYKENQLTEKHLASFLDDIQTSSEMITTTMKRASELIQSFKLIAVEQSYDEQRNVNITEYISEIVTSLTAELKNKSIEVNINSDEALTIYSHTGAIYQIILNLIMNSLKHGFNDGYDGKVDISVYRIKSGFSVGKPREICINYRDDGVGIKAENITKIFEPFFTTKRAEGGSGLGLHIVYNLVTQKLNGRIECKSEVEEFTEFKIIFPIEQENDNELVETDKI